MFMTVLMEKIGFHFLILALCIVVSLFENFMEVNSGQKNSSEFELVKKDKGIALYERWYKMGSGELTREVKAVGNIDAPLDSAIALLKNESQAKNGTKVPIVSEFYHRKEIIGSVTSNIICHGQWRTRIVYCKIPHSIFQKVIKLSILKPWSMNFFRK